MAEQRPESQTAAGEGPAGADSYARAEDGASTTEDPNVGAGARASSTIARSAASAGAATMASRILGVVREMVLATLFGAGDAMDAYRVAFRVPNLLRDLFAEGAMSAAFVPTFTHRLTTADKASALRLGNNVLNALLLVTTAFVLLGMVFADSLVGAFASSYADVPGKLELTATLARIMLPFLTFVALAAAFMGMLNALHHFFVPALSPAMFNVASIVCAIALVPVMPLVGLPAIAAIAVGTLAGGIAQWAIQWPLLHREGFRYRPVIDWRDEGLRRVLLLMGPATLGLAATQVNVFVNTWLATGEGTGPVSWLDYAFRLMYLPIGLFGVSIATATIPTVSRHAAARDEASVRRTVADGMSLMMMLNVPATVGLVVLADPIIELMYEHGRFTPADTRATAAALQFYAIGLLGYSVVRIASPTFYAIGQNRTPVKVSVATVITNAALNVALVRVLGYRGLALGTSIAALFNASTLLFLLHRRLHGLEERRVVRSLLKITTASVLMGGAAAGIDRAMTLWVPGEVVPLQLLRLTASIGGGIVTLAIAAHLLHIREFREGTAFVTRRFRRRAR